MNWNGVVYYPMSNGRKRLLTDSNVCTGCRYCEAICSLVHLGEVNPRLSRIKVIENTEKGTAKVVVCRQCSRPPCVKACPEGAMEQDSKTGAIIIKYERCNSCMACVDACPFGTIFISEAQKLPLVCDLCGGDPMCVKFCRNYPHKGHAALAYTTAKEWAKMKREIPSP